MPRAEAAAVVALNANVAPLPPDCDPPLTAQAACSPQPPFIVSVPLILSPRDAVELGTTIRIFSAPACRPWLHATFADTSSQTTSLAGGFFGGSADAVAGLAAGFAAGL